MAILNADALREIESKVVRWKRNGHTLHGYPLSEVTDLCDIIACAEIIMMQHISGRHRLRGRYLLGIY